jgi:hypothetical protein
MKKYTSPESKEYAQKESNRFIYLLGFFIPLYSLSVNFFVQWSWYKLLPFILLVVIFIRRRKKFHPRKDIFQLATILICYMFIITLCNYFLNMESGRFQYAVEAGQYYLRTYGHMIVQFVMIVAALSQLFLFSYLIKTRKGVDVFVGGFIDGNVISIMVGITHYIACRMDIPLGWLRLYGAGGGFMRMSGLGGEPRHFGAFLSLALLILITNHLSNRPIAIKNPLVKGGILAGGLFFSLSTSAWLGFLGGILIICLFTLDLKRLGQIIAISFCLIALLAFNNNFKTLVHDRLLSRMESLNYFLYFAPKDGIALKLISNNLRVCLLGTGSGGSDFYTMNPTFLDSISDVILRAGIVRVVHEGKVSNSLSPSSFFIKFWAEYGVVGIILLFLLVRAVLRRIKTTPYCQFVVLISAAVLIASVPSSMLLVYVYFSLLSVLYGFYYQQSSKRVVTSGKILRRVDE